MLKFLCLGISLILFIETNGQVFDTTNSDPKDPAEARLTYPPTATETFMPPCCGLKVTPCTNTYYRRLDGSCTNFLHPEWGVPNSTYYRLFYRRDMQMVSVSRELLWTAVIFHQLGWCVLASFPTGQIVHNFLTLNAMQFGQFVAHDMSLIREPPQPIKCCTATGKMQNTCGRYCFPVKIPLNDPTMGKAGIMCTNFTRTVTDRDMGCAAANAPAQQINVVTSFLDLSNVYGIGDAMSRGLRSMLGGQLRVEVRNGKSYPPREADIRANCPCSQPGETACYVTGDPRSNQSPQLTILQTMFVREHNRLARGLASVNPSWVDERLFQEARRINIAAYQRITYYEWLPIFLGANNLVSNSINFPNAGFTNDYNQNVNPAVSSEHAQGAFRFFHTNIAGWLRLINLNRGVQSTIQISDWFNRPQILETGYSMDQLTMGMVTQLMEQTDEIIVEQVADRMFACPGAQFGIDLRATDFQRDRDHGLAYYNDYRRVCGLRDAKSFDDFSDAIDVKKIAILKTLYRSHLDVDLSVGGSLEWLVQGAQAGPTFICIMNDQFRRTRQADRLFFENAGAGFTAAQLTEIRKSSIARFFCDNGDTIRDIQSCAFTSIAASNPVVPCGQIQPINLNLWKA